MKAKLIFALPLFILIIWGCEPKPDSTELLDQLVVQTQNDDTVAYGLYTTFAIPTDTIALYSNAYNAPPYVTIADSPDFVRPVVNAVITNMINRNYTQISRKQNPDLGINISIVHDYSIYQSVYGGGYGSGYYGYGGYYGGYGGYPYVITTEENRGSLIIEIVDLKNKTPDNKVKVVWTASLSDLFNAIDEAKESVDGINQAFKQSPYIITNN